MQDGAWITANRRSFFDYSVGSLVPVVFERYARVLHPAWAAGDQPVRWNEVAAWSGRTIHRLAQWEFLSRPLIDRHAATPFVEPPRPDGLPPPHLAAVCDLLAAHTSTPDQCFVAVWEGYGWLEWSEWRSSPVLVLDQRTFLVRRGSIDLAQAVGYGAPSGTRVAEPPTILWPADRAWFVASDPDLDSTYLGGSDALIESLLAHRDLEAWPAEPGDRVAVDSDEINAPEQRLIGPKPVVAVAQDLDPDLVVVRRRPDGSESHAPMGVRLAQALHHGTDHRSQICTALTTLAVEPPAIDVWDYASQDDRLVEVSPAS